MLFRKCPCYQRDSLWGSWLIYWYIPSLVFVLDSHPDVAAWPQIRGFDFFPPLVLALYFVFLLAVE